MFCPNCGLENSKGQKFCRRCGANLQVYDLAQNLITEVATGKPANQVESNHILKIIAFISTFGFLVVTGGAVGLTAIQYAVSEMRHEPPFGLFLAFFGYGAIVLICRRLLKLMETARIEAKPFLVQPALPAQPYAPPLPSQTNRNLAAAPVYTSITEQETQQFEHERRANS